MEAVGPSSSESDEAPTFLISGGSCAQSFSREQAQVLSREGARKAEAVKPVLRMSATGAFTTTDLVTPVSEESVPLPLPAGIVNTLLSPSFPPKSKPLSINRSSQQDPESPLPPTLSTLPQVSTCPPTHLPSIQIVRSLSLLLRNSSVPPNTESKRSNYQIPNPSYVFLRPTLNYTQLCETCAAPQVVVLRTNHTRTNSHISAIICRRLLDKPRNRGGKDSKYTAAISQDSRPSDAVGYDPPLCVRICMRAHPDTNSLFMCMHTRSEPARFPK
jgi:hypothetical protein